MSIRLLSVLCVHLGFSIPATMTSDFERIFYPRFYPLLFCPILILEKEPVFPFNIKCLTRELLVPFL